MDWRHKIMQVHVTSKPVLEYYYSGFDIRIDIILLSVSTFIISVNALGGAYGLCLLGMCSQY